jgi:DNA gyrase subunit A
VDEISQMGRNTQGVRVINLKTGDAIADVTRVVIEDDDLDANGEPADGEAPDAGASGDGQATPPPTAGEAGGDGVA